MSMSEKIIYPNKNSLFISEKTTKEFYSKRKQFSERIEKMSECKFDKNIFVFR
jgi:hypothetical protein